MTESSLDRMIYVFCIFCGICFSIFCYIYDCDDNRPFLLRMRGFFKKLSCRHEYNYYMDELGRAGNKRCKKCGKNDY